MAVFAVYKSEDDGDNWTLILNTVDGTFPSGGEDMSGRLWCFYVDGGNLNVTYSDDQGANWETGAVVISTVDDASTSFWEDVFGFLWVSYWKSSKMYVAYHNPSDAVNVWTAKEVA